MKKTTQTRYAAALENWKKNATPPARARQAADDAKATCASRLSWTAQPGDYAAAAESTEAEAAAEAASGNNERAATLTALAAELRAAAAYR
jgi:hypothetical protein